MTKNDYPKMYSMISVKQIGKETNSFGPQFEVTTVNSFTGYVAIHEVYTNSHGNGLWIDGNQTLGTCQFSAGNNPREAIRNYFKKS